MSVLVRRPSGPGLLGLATARLGARSGTAQPRSHVVARAAATLVWLAVVLVQVAALAVWLGRGAPRLPVSFAGGPGAVLAITLGSLLTLSMGAFLARRLPGSLVGWVMMATGIAAAPVLASALMVSDALEVLRPVPALTIGVAWLVSSVSVPVAIGSLAVVLVLFPDGRPSSPRWAVALLVPITGMVLLSVGSAVDRSLTWYPMLPGPFDDPVMGAGAAAMARFLGFASLVVSVVIAAGSLIDRYRDADERLRCQVRWVVLGGSLAAVTLAPLLVARYLLRPADGLGEVLMVIAALGVATFPVTVAIAITRADLFDIDVIIGRTLVYVPLTAILAGMFAALVTLLQRLFVALTGDTSDAVIVISTLVLAATFTPVRQALDGFVERRFRAHGPRASDAGAAATIGTAAEGVGALLTALAAQTARLEFLEARLRRLEEGPASQPSAQHPDHWDIDGRRPAP